MDTYREKIIFSYLALEAAQDDVFEQIINVGMAGVFKEINDSFLKDDQYVFDVVQFRDTDDFNLKILLRIYDTMEESMDSLIFENDIGDEEVEEVRIAWLESFESNIDDFDDENGFDM